MPVLTKNRLTDKSINGENSFASFGDDEIGVIIDKNKGKKTTVSVIDKCGSKSILLGDKHTLPCRNNDNPCKIVSAYAERNGCKFYPKNTERKKYTKKPIKRRHGKNGHIINRFYSGREF